jgi:hypothetical protein
MDLVRATLHVANRTVDASVAAAGAVGGAAVNGVVGGVQCLARGNAREKRRLSRW